MRRSYAAGLILSLFACNAAAQLPAFNPDWKETEVPAPPAFKTDRLILLDMPQHVSLKIGVDPDTLAITADGLVRYVVVMVSTSGATNASYEGIRCVSGEVKVYARQTANGRWAPVSDPQWVPLSSGQRSAHAPVLARQGVCVGRSSSAQSPAEIVARLKSASRDSSQR